MIYAIISILSFCIVLFAGIYVFAVNPQKKVNKLFLAFSLLTACFCLLEYKALTAPTYENALIWTKYHIILIPIMLVTVFHFIRSFYKLSNRKTDVLFFVSMDIFLAFTIITFFVFGISLEMKSINGYWVKTPIHNSGITEKTFLSFIFLLTVIISVITIKHFRKTKGKERIKASFLLIGILFPSWIPFLFNVVATTMNYPFAMVDSLPIVIGWIFFVISIWKFRIFDITPIRAANNIISIMTEALLLLDDHGNIKSANKAFYQLFRTNLLTIKDKSASMFLTQYKIQPKSIEKRFFTEEINNEIYKLNIYETPKTYISFSSSFLKDGDKKIVGYVWILNDVTKLVHAQKRLQKKQSQMISLAHKAGMAEVATDVMHNIGNVLNSVNISSEHIALLLNNSQLKGFLKANETYLANHDKLLEIKDAPQKSDLLVDYYKKIGTELLKEREAILEETKLLIEKVKIIRNIIELQQDYSKTRSYTENVPIDTLIENVIKMYDDSFKKNDVELIKEYPEDAHFMLETDRSKLMNVLLNIIKNAYESIKLNPDSEKRTIKIGLQKTSHMLKITISDNGKGISEAEMAQLFSYRFTTKADGHGFGLHYCKNTVEELNGTIRANSQGIGKGAEFIISFKLK